MGFWSNKQRVLADDCAKCGMSETLIKNGVRDFRQDEWLGKCGKGIILVAPPRLLPELQFGQKYGNTYGGRELARLASQYIDIYADTLIIPAARCPIVSIKKSGVNAGQMSDTDTFTRLYCCRSHIVKAAKDCKAKLVICIGNVALRVLYGNRGLENLSAYYMNNYCFPDYEMGAWVATLPDFDEIIMADNRQRDEKLTTFSRQFGEVIQHVQKPLPPQVDYNRHVKVLTEYLDVMEALTRVVDTRPEWFDFDYETNAIKPQFPQSQMYSVSWAVDDDIAYSHPFGGWSHFSSQQLRSIYKVFKAIMADKAIKKAAHNIHMENSWTEHYLQQPVCDWGWDSMIAAHFLDTTEGTKGLKFQVFARYGFGPYNTYVKPFFENSDNPPYNAIDKTDRLKVLHYGGLDSLFGRKLRQLQMEALDYGKGVPNRMRDCYLGIYLPGAVTMSDMSLTGLRIDVDQYEKVKLQCLEEQKQIEREINSDPDVIKCRSLNNGEFSLSSSDNLRFLFFNMLGFKAKATTSTGLDSVNKDFLEDIEYPLAKKILRWRKLEKIAGTFIAQYTREAAYGTIHAEYSLCVARSGRSACNSPNMQNIPKRDKWAKGILRSGLYPKLGHRLTEADYGSQEIRIYTCNSKDPVLIDYLVKGGDMHYDEAMHVYDIDSRKHVSKPLRNCMKMGWNFALLYGSYYKSCANRMWEEIFMQGVRLANDDGSEGITVREHMAKKGIRTLPDFVDWCKKKEDEFWTKFHVAKEYRDGAAARYKQTGYIETLFGFRRAGYLSGNQVVNTPTQGSGFQCLLWSCNEINKYIKEKKLQTRLCGQVHDSMLSSVHPDEFQEYTEVQHDIMSKKIRERFDFLIVPLEVECDAGDVDAPWSSLKPLEKKDGIWTYVA